MLKNRMQSIGLAVALTAALATSEASGGGLEDTTGITIAQAETRNDLSAQSQVEGRRSERERFAEEQRMQKEIERLVAARDSLSETMQRVGIKLLTLSADYSYVDAQMADGTRFTIEFSRPSDYPLNQAIVDKIIINGRTYCYTYPNPHRWLHFHKRTGRHYADQITECLRMEEVINKLLDKYPPGMARVERVVSLDIEQLHFTFVIEVRVADAIESIECSYFLGRGVETGGGIQ